MPDELVPAQPKGVRLGGRAKGTPNKRTEQALEIMHRLGVDPIEGMARIALGDVPCGVCHGTTKTKFQPKRGLSPTKEWPERTCESCYGSGKEKISPELKAQMLTQLAPYAYSKKAQSVEVSGPEGEPIKAAILVKFVDPPERGN